MQYTDNSGWTGTLKHGRPLVASAFATIVAVFALTPQALGRVIFVDNQLSGDCIGTYSIARRDNSGSDGDAYDRAQDAADIVEPGDTVYFREGTYSNPEHTRDGDAVINILRSGTADQPITFTNYNNEEVIFSGYRPPPRETGRLRVFVLGIPPSTQSGPQATT